MKEKLEILDLLEKKEITAEEAEKRLDALREKNVAKQAVSGKTLKIMIVSSDGDNVNVQVPVNFARLFLKGKSRIVKNSTFHNMDVDFEEVLNMLDSGAIGELVNISSADGDTVRIFVE